MYDINVSSKRDEDMRYFYTKFIINLSRCVMQMFYISVGKFMA